jgi:acyl carrier protein
MNIENLIQIFQSEFPEVSEKFTPATKFRELSNWDSLTSMSILTTIEEQFGATLPEKEFKAMHTIEEVYFFLSK